MKSPWENMDEAKNMFFYNNKNKFLQKFNFNFSAAVIPVIMLVLFIIWMLSGIYKVNEGEEAVVVRFGKYARKAYPGLNYRLPSPIEEAIVEKVKISRQTEIGYRTSGRKSLSNSTYSIFQNSHSTDNRRYSVSDSTMLTGDENIIELNCNVRWHIKNLYDFIFNVDDPENTVNSVAESAIREVISETLITSVLSNQKQEIADKIEHLIQQILDQYSVGIEIEAVELLKAEPPSEVIDAYRDVQTSRADKEREINQAQAYRNDKIPEARGAAARMLEEAEGLKQSTIAKAVGDTQKFNAILVQYQLNKEVTKERLYLNTIESILQGSKKFIISDDSKLLPHMGILSK